MISPAAEGRDRPPIRCARAEAIDAREEVGIICYIMNITMPVVSCGGVLSVCVSVAARGAAALMIGLLASPLPALGQATQPSPSAVCVPATTRPEPHERPPQAPEPREESRAEPRAEPMSTDRPDFTEATGAVAPGRVQLELGYTFVHDRGGARRARRHVGPETLLRIGLLEHNELRLGWDGYTFGEQREPGAAGVGRRRATAEHVDGAADISVGVKQELWPQDAWRPAFSLLGELSLPSGSPGASSGDVDPTIKLLYSWELPRRFSLGGNLNFAVPTGEQGRYLETSASLALGWEAAEWLGVFVEYFGIFPHDRGADCAHYVNGGFTFPITENTQFDVRVGAGLNEAADDFFAGVGFAIRF